MQGLRPILLVEDNEDDIFFMHRALKSAELRRPVHVVNDGELAIQYFRGEGVFACRADYPLPCFVFLDLKLPKRSGIDVLQWVRSQPETQGTVVVILTSSSEPKDIEMATRYGANAYLVKPAKAPDLVEMVQAIKSFWFQYHQFVHADVTELR
jgi:CheY-like chemotaxis protein